jgi:hypothetical protein
MSDGDLVLLLIGGGIVSVIGILVAIRTGNWDAD